jgi:WD40 repeat protein
VSLVLAGLLLVLGSVLGPTARAQTGEPILRIETGTHTARMADAATDAAGRVLVTASEDKTARIWSLPDLRPLGVLRPPIGPEQDGLLFAVAVSPDGRLAAVAGALGPRGGEKSVLLFDLRSREVVRRWAGPPNGTYSLAFSADGVRLAAGFGGAYGIRVWSVADGREVFRDGDYADRVKGLSFAPDGRLAVTSFDGFLRLYDATGKRLRKVVAGPGASARPSRAAFSPDGGKLAVGFENSVAVEVRDGHTLALLFRPVEVEVRDPRTLRLLDNHTLAALFLRPNSVLTATDLPNVAWSRDGTQLFAGGDVTTRTGKTKTGSGVVVWSAAGRGPRRIIDAGSDDATSGIAPLADGAIVMTSLSGDIALTGPDGTRRATVMPMRADFRIDPEDHRGLLVSDDGKRVAWMQLRANGRWEVADAGGFDLAAAAQPPAGLAGWSENATRISVTQWDRTDPKLNFRVDPANPRVLALEPLEVSRSVAVRDGRVLLGTEWMLRLFDGAGQPVWGHPVPGEALRVNQSGDGRLAVAALNDGTVRWYRLSDGQELLALFLTRDAKRWVAFTPSGYYAASPGGEDLIGWHINRGPDKAADFFPASRFHDRMYRPDVVRLVLDTLDENAALKQANAASGRAETQVTLADIPTLAPPVLDLVSAPTRFATDHVSIQYRVRTPAGAPMLGDPRVKVNGEWQPTSRAVQQLAADGTRVVVVGPLPPRDSTVEIYADNGNARSEPLTLALKWDGRAALAPGQQGLATQRKPRLFVLAVGISQYQRPDLRLNFAARDAEKFVAAMQAQRGKLYAEVTTKLLRDDEATLAGVKAGLAWFADQAAADDVGVLFLAGHGVQTPDQNYFYAPADFDPAREHATGVDYRAIRSALDKFSTAGNKVLFFVDTCYPGGALGPNLAASNGTAFAAVLSRSDSGIVVLSASKGDQLSYEGPQWQDGAFTKALLEGIVDAKADPARSGEITILDLGSYVHKRVLVLTERRQEPTLSMPEGGVADFTVAAH